MTRTERKTKPLGVKLFAYLSLLVAVTIVLLWVFQVVLLGRSFRAVTLSAMKKGAARIVDAIDTPEIESTVYDIAEDLDACISVYRIKDARGNMLVRAHAGNGCYIHALVSGPELSAIYSLTKDADGSLVYSDKEESVGSMVYSRLVNGDGEAYLILFDTAKFPVGTTARTITLQLVVITVILVAFAAVLAAVISRKITRPVKDLCTEAEKLGAGELDVYFSGKGTAETEKLGDTLNYAAAELSRAAGMQRELLANVSHDIRTPLTLISGYSEVMRDIPGEMNAENMQVIIDEAARLTALVNDVLDMQNGGTLEITEFSLNTEAKAEADRYAAMLAPKGYTVTYETDGNDAAVRADKTKIMQALCNLLNNAVNFAGEDKTVEVKQTVEGGVCRTEVTDHGAGIAKEDLPEIWDRYYRARDRKTKGIPGTGLGLAIVKKVMTDHGASFGVSSAPGEGSTFWFELPTI